MRALRAWRAATLLVACVATLTAFSSTAPLAAGAAPSDAAAQTARAGVMPPSRIEADDVGLIEALGLSGAMSGAASGGAVSNSAASNGAASDSSAQTARAGVMPPSRSEADDARLIEALGVARGSTVGEIGAGAGAMTIKMSHEVGASGRVYSSELGDKQLRDLRKAVTDAGASNVTIVNGDPNQTDFPDACCDAVFMQNVYHHFANPPAMNASILRSLKPGGRLAVMDFAPRGGTSAPPAERGDGDSKHGVTADTVRAELTAAGFEFVSTEKRGEERAFLVVVRKPGT